MSLLKTLLIIFFSIIAVLSSFSNEYADSLENKLKKSEGKEKLIILHDLAWEYYKTDPSKSIFFGKEAVILSQELRDSSMLAYSYRYTGIGYKMTGLYDEALDYYFKSLKILQHLGNDKSVAKTLISIGNIYGELTLYDEAKEYLKKALATAKSKITEPATLVILNTYFLPSAS
ncbi:MAG: hypothetical protein DRJ05_13860 [Bacteroidetes bacterium]|nr:MAG: hypothetical protein DRJ05_13860 [Bacteroidota bacterium]